MLLFIGLIDSIVLLHAWIKSWHTNWYNWHQRQSINVNQHVLYWIINHPWNVVFIETFITRFRNGRCWVLPPSHQLLLREIPSTTISRFKKNSSWIIWVFPKIGYPQIIHFNRVFHYKPSILGYPYFWKHPHRCVRFFSRI